jgi:hypothetical protein
VDVGALVVVDASVVLVGGWVVVVVGSIVVLDSLVVVVVLSYVDTSGEH